MTFGFQKKILALALTGFTVLQGCTTSKTLEQKLGSVICGREPVSAEVIKGLSNDTFYLARQSKHSNNTNQAMIDGVRTQFENTPNITGLVNVKNTEEGLSVEGMTQMIANRQVYQGDLVNGSITNSMETNSGLNQRRLQENVCEGHIETPTSNPTFVPNGQFSPDTTIIQIPPENKEKARGIFLKTTGEKTPDAYQYYQDPNFNPTEAIQYKKTLKSFLNKQAGMTEDMKKLGTPVK